MSTPLLTPLRSRNAAPLAPDRAAIILVHGFGGDPHATWGSFPELLIADDRLKEWDLFSVGYATRLVPDIVGLWSANAPLDRLALMLHAASVTAPLSTYGSLAILAHSMGGLVTQRALVDHADFAGRVSQLFLFGTPSAGLAKAGPFSFLKRQARDMGQASEFITGLRQRWDQQFRASAPFRLSTIAGDQDEFVPSDSSLLPFPLETRFVVPGNHVSIVKPLKSSDLPVQIVLSGMCGDASAAGPRNAARVAVESRRFREAIQILQPIGNELDEYGLVTLALALEETGRSAEAIGLLEANARTQTDAMGVLAGLLKRRWLVERRRTDAVRSLDLYKTAYQTSSSQNNHAQAYYHGINVAFMELAYGSDHKESAQMAKQVLDHCEQATADFWRTATEAEAHLLLGETDLSLQAYRRATAYNPEPRQFKSMCQQALRIADLMNDEVAEAQVRSIYEGEAVATA